jgi:hypothetical protein
VSNVVRIPITRPRVYTSAEAMIGQVREKVLTCGHSYTLLAGKAGVSATTIGNLAIGKTRWPRPTTLFPLLVALKMHLELVEDD